jgi:maleate cis-trans isomerase
MFEDFVPTRKIGTLLPSSVIDNHPYEFYRLVPRGIMLVMVGVGLKEFSSGDVDRVFTPLNGYLDQLMGRGVDMVTQNGVPLPILMGIEKHDRMIAHMADYTGKPATSTVLSVVSTAKDLGIRKVAIVNKWTDAMNASLGNFFARGGVEISGRATRSLDPAAFHRIATGDHMLLAYELGKQAIADNPDCDAIYIGGGSWIAEPVAARLEADFGKTVLCNQTAVIRHNMKMMGVWKPIPGHSRVLNTP